MADSVPHEAWDIIVEQIPMAHTIMARMNVPWEDRDALFSDVLIPSILSALRRYDPMMSSFPCFAWMVMRGAILNARRRGPVRTYATEEMDLHPAQNKGPAEQAEISDLLDRALSLLCDEDREMLTLRYLDGTPVAEIAAQRDCSRENVYRILRRALRRARKGLEQSDPPPPQ